MHVKPDGFLRLPLDALLSARLVHLVSGLDDTCGAHSDRCGRVTSLTGYTEWVSVSVPAVTLGWDWSIVTLNGELRCIRNGLPRTNVMLVDGFDSDYGWKRNMEALATVADAIPWIEETYHVLLTDKSEISLPTLRGSYTK